MKLKIIRLYRDEEIEPDLVQQVKDTVDQIGKALDPVVKDKGYNIVLSAFNRFHAAMIVSMVSPSFLKEAAETEAVGLVKNIEHMSGKVLWPQKEDENGLE